VEALAGLMAGSIRAAFTDFNVNRISGGGKVRATAAGRIHGSVKDNK
jgi:hypothetical protein